MKKYKRILALSLAVLMMMSTFITFPATAVTKTSEPVSEKTTYESASAKTTAESVSAEKQTLGTLLANFDFEDDDNWQDGGNAVATEYENKPIDFVEHDGGRAANFSSNDTIKNALEIKKSDGTPLLTGYNNLRFSFDFKRNSDHWSNWPFFVAKDDSQYEQNVSVKNYISCNIRGDRFTSAPGRVEVSQNKDNADSGNIFYNKLDPDQWYHIDVIFTGSKIILYVDNEWVGAEKATSSIVEIIGDSSIFRIGYSHFWREYSSMQLDNFKVYGYDSEVKTIADIITLPSSTFEDVKLPTTVENLGEVTWTSDNESVITSDGKVTRPQNDTVVTLTATFSIDGNTATKEFQVTVMGNTEGVAVDKTVEKINGGYKLSMSAYVTGQSVSTTVEKPSDIVLVLDQSASMVSPVGYTEKTGEEFFTFDDPHTAGWDGMVRYELTDLNANADLQSKAQRMGYFLAQSRVEGNGKYLLYNVEYKPGEAKPWIFYPRKSTEFNTSSGAENFERLEYASLDEIPQDQYYFYKTQYANLYDSVSGFVEKLHDSGVAHRVSIVGFAHPDWSHVYVNGNAIFYKSATNTNYSDSLMNVSVESDYEKLLKSLNAYKADYAWTGTSTGLDMAVKVFENATTVATDNADIGRNKTVILFTDGAANVTIDGTEADYISAQNEAIEKANVLKNTHNATVYSIGTSTLAGQNFLNYISSDYPNATSMDSPGTQISNPVYTQKITNAEDMNIAFDSVNITTSETLELGTDTVLREVITDYFSLPSEVKESDIKVYTADYLGYGNFADKVLYDSAIVSTNGRADTINVTGFDYAANYLYNDGTNHGGKKLIVEIPIVVRDGFWGGNNVPTNKSETAIYKDQLKVMQFPIPEVNIPISTSITTCDKTIYYGGININPKDLVTEIKAGGKTVNINNDGTLTPSEAWMDDYATLSWAENSTTPVSVISNTNSKSYIYSVNLKPKYDGTKNISQNSARIVGNAVAVGGVSASDTSSVRVLVPVLTFKDSEIHSGATLDDAYFNSANRVTGVKWVDISDYSTELSTTDDTEPKLYLSYESVNDTLTSAIKVDVTVKRDSTNGQDITGVTQFCWNSCTSELHNSDSQNIATHIGNADSPEFRIHISSALTITKNVVDSNGDNVASDDTEYTFRLKDSSSGNVITGTSTQGAFQRYENEEWVNYSVNTNGEFTLKNGESVYFNNLNSDKQYIIEEINNPIYVKSTKAYVDGNQQSGTQATVTPETDSAKVVEFINTLKSVDINFKFYNRDPSTGKTADISSTVNTYTKTYMGKEYGDLFVESPGNNQTQFSNMILTAGTYFDTKYKNVLDAYELFTSQATAESAITSFPNYHANADGSVKYETQKYHTDCHGNPQTSGEKWVTYKDGNGEPIDEDTLKDNNASVETIDVWLFNHPKQYDVSVYGATESGHLNQIGDKYVANEINHSEYKAFYNQRLGSAIDNGGYIDSATDYLEAYGISGYIGQSVITASAIGNLKFSYWSFDKDGKTVASTDRRYNYRIKNKLTLYAVYETTPLSAKKDDSGNIVKGLSVSMNDPDIFMEKETEKIRLNTEINPYNCPDQDTNIQNVAAVYIIDKYANVVMDDGIVTQLKQIITDNLSAIKRETSGSTYKAIDISKLNSPKTITDCDGHEVALTKGNYYVYYVDAFVSGSEGQVILTNKNRAEFLISFAKDTLKNRRLFAFGAMLYGSDVSSASWITSDNCIDYAFDENSEAYDPLTTVNIPETEGEDSPKKLVFDAGYYKEHNKAEYAELVNMNEDQLYKHFLEVGIKKGLQAHPCFDVKYYLENNDKLKNAYGSTNYIAAINHYVTYDLNNPINTKTADPVIIENGAEFIANISPYYFQNIENPRYLTIGNNAEIPTNVGTETADSNDNKMKWRFTKQEDDSYTIRNESSGLYMKAINSNHQVIQTSDYDSSDAGMRWYIYKLPNGNYIFQPVCANNLILDVGVTPVDGVYRAVTWYAANLYIASNRQFTLENITPTNQEG